MYDLLFMIRYRILAIMRSVGRDSAHRKSEEAEVISKVIRGHR